ncbi:hypothetical protein [Piscinibacterium candidicorallinum]|uniref:Uncharacterized protein n=1 Tax=Piscinibacterium candidicorallinum TaxID=1793872 RepID=A0ABV7H5M9_9BURK
MYKMFIEFFLARPGRLSAIGRAAFHLSGIILLIGLCGRIATVGVSAMQGVGGARPYVSSFALLSPSLPTWRVPESFLGYGACVLVAALGLLLVQMGKAIDTAIG